MSVFSLFTYRLTYIVIVVVYLTVVLFSSIPSLSHIILYWQRSFHINSNFGDNLVFLLSFFFLGWDERTVGNLLWESSICSTRACLWKVLHWFRGERVLQRNFVKAKLFYIKIYTHHFCFTMHELIERTTTTVDNTRIEHVNSVSPNIPVNFIIPS